ncbi:MAG: bifunctional hydroxymethylpyrimidine kinase/phosphomethylpyrimidine kinase [Ferrovibrionaceae bacterium]
MIPNALTIAGVDPSGGAGIVADLKAFSALGAYGCAVVAALTAQNTRAVTGVELVDPAFVRQQIDTLYDDVRIDAVKLGMLGTAQIIAAVADGLVARNRAPIVLDPVMVAKSGASLLAMEAVTALRARLLPLATVITPNLPEAGVLLDRPPPATLADMRDAARALQRLGPRWVLLKGGHLADGPAVDIIDDGERQIELSAPRIATKNTHGTGCTLSAAIAALLPQRSDPIAAIEGAKAYLTAAIAESGSLAVGAGHGPVHHFHALWPASSARD